MPLDFIKNYFTQEKIESIFFILIGMLAISFALISWFIVKYSFYKGLAYTLFLIGVIQVVVGITVYIRSPKDITRVEQFVKTEPQKIQTEEIPRMKKVITNFELYKWIEIVLIVIGIVLFIYFKTSTQVFWKGLGLGLIIQASLMLSLDVVAEKRAVSYINQLQTL